MEAPVNLFKKATKEQLKIKIGISGPAGSGKTMSAIKLASGLGKKIAFIDTERGSANMYSHIANFDHCNLTEPYTTKRFIELINNAQASGYDTIIIDSISHQWAGQSGILDRKTIKDSIGGSSFLNWKDFTVEQNQFVSCILNCDANVICTMRSKTDYVVEQNEKGKQAPRKVGLAPIQREGFDYELSIVFDVSQNHIASVSKDRTGIFDGRNFIIDEKIGKEIKDFITSGRSPEPNIKEIIFVKAKDISDQNLKTKIMEAVLAENNMDKLQKYSKRVDSILIEQSI